MKRGYLSEYLNDPIGAYVAVKRDELEFVGLTTENLRDMVKVAITPWRNGFMSAAQKQALLLLKTVDPELIEWFKTAYIERHSDGEHESPADKEFITEA